MVKYAALLLIVVYAFFLVFLVRNFIESDRAARKQLKMLEELLDKWIKEDEEEEERRSGDHANHS